MLAFGELDVRCSTFIFLAFDVHLFVLPSLKNNFKLLLNDLKLNQDRDTLKRILENALPSTLQDVVIVYVSVCGRHEGGFAEENFVRKIYPREISGRMWSAIQVATAAGLCSVLDIVLSDPAHYCGFVSQESIALTRFMSSPYGQYYE